MKGTLFPFESLSGLDETLPAGEGMKDINRDLYTLRRARTTTKTGFLQITK